MARIHLIQKDEAGFPLRLLFRIAQRVTKELTGKAILAAPVRAHAHSMGLFWGMSFMESAQGSASTVPARLKALASLRVSTLVGCPF
ncbi:MAG: hypothetical protein R3C14_37935 [Caldilineaceae bacterium]